MGFEIIRRQRPVGPLLHPCQCTCDEGMSRLGWGGRRKVCAYGEAKQEKSRDQREKVTELRTCLYLFLIYKTKDKEKR